MVLVSDIRLHAHRIFLSIALVSGRGRFAYAAFTLMVLVSDLKLYAHRSFIITALVSG